MSKLGYMWFPQDWLTSTTFKRLKKFPMVRYAIRELIDLMYSEGKPIEMNREFLSDDFNIDLSDAEYLKLMEFIHVEENGRWWINSIKRRLSKAETARENGTKGGRPRKDANHDKKEGDEITQKPTEKTQTENPKNPPYKNKVNKSKIKESKVNEIKESVYKNFLHLSISDTEFDKLLSLGYTKDQIDDTLENIQNYKNNKNYVSLFLTAKNWLKKDHGEKKADIPADETPEQKARREYLQEVKTQRIH